MVHVHALVLGPSRREGQCSSGSGFMKSTSAPASMVIVVYMMGSRERRWEAICLN